MRYVSIYTNSRTVQGHHIYFLVSRVNIFSQGNVQRVTPTFLVKVPTVGYITKSVMSLLVNVIHVGICWKVCGVNGIHYK